jgi:hypothetical protein
MLEGMEAPFTPEQQAKHEKNGFVCVGAAEIRDGPENGTFSVRAVEPLVPKWCTTPACTSTEVGSVRVIGSPQIIHDKSGMEHDLLLYAYEGQCPACHVTRLGGFGRYMGGPDPTAIVWLFSAGRLVERS